jgi:hypothetical protein
VTKEASTATNAKFTDLKSIYAQSYLASATRKDFIEDIISSSTRSEPMALSLPLFSELVPTLWMNYLKAKEPLKHPSVRSVVKH